MTRLQTHPSRFRVELRLLLEGALVLRGDLGSTNFSLFLTWTTPDGLTTRGLPVVEHAGHANSLLLTP